MEHIIKKIKQTRKDLGYSHETMAQLLGISQVAYSKLEKSETKLSVERCYKIAAILTIPIIDLLSPDKTHHTEQTLHQLKNHPEAINDNTKSKTKHAKIEQLYELGLKDKDEMINELKSIIQVLNLHINGINLKSELLL